MKKFEIEITKKAQLIDLNDSNKNFEIKFKVVAQNEEEFLAIVLNKEELDKYSDLDELEMKKSPGVIKGTLECNEDKRENYFLVVKKDGNPCKATVEIDMNEIEKFVDIDQYSSNQQPSKDNSVSVILNKYFYHILGFLIVVSLLYYFYSKNNVKSEVPPISTSSSSGNITIPPPAPAPSSVSTLSEPLTTTTTTPSVSMVSDTCQSKMSDSIKEGLNILNNLESC